MKNQGGDLFGSKYNFKRSFKDVVLNVAVQLLQEYSCNIFGISRIQISVQMYEMMLTGIS
jgi:hypothetical protein